MKAKSSAKISRRVAGLPIRATLEPRPDSGINPATNIFRAAKENTEASNNFESIKSSTISANTQKLTEENQASVLDSDPTAPENDFERRSEASDAANQTPSEFQNVEAEIVPGTALMRFGGGQMRVVSLQPPKPRKFPKKPKKTLQVVTNSNELDKTSQLFERAKAEELYDLLHQLTLGAEEPCNSVRVRRSDLMMSTNIKTRITLDLNLKRLEENGLIKVESRPGEQEGNIYTVFPLKTIKS